MSSTAFSEPDAPARPLGGAFNAARRSRAQLHGHGPESPAIRELDAAPELPHVEADVASLANRLLCRTDALRLRIAGSDWWLRFLPHDPGRQNTAANAYAFTLGPTAGRLLPDLGSERRLLSVPGDAETLPALLRHALMADALAGVAQAVAAHAGQPFTWQHDGAGPRSGAPCFDLALWRVRGESEVDGGDETVSGAVVDSTADTLHATLQLDQPDLLAALPPRRPRAGEPLPAWMAQLRMPVAVRIGTTTMPIGEMRDIRPGDIISIERWQAQGGALNVQCTTGANGLSWPALAEGRRITIQRPASPKAAPTLHGDTMEDRTTGQGELPHPDATPAALERLEDLEVALRFEVGDVSLALAELREVRPGYVFELPQPLKQSEVRIVTSGRILGTGTLIAVGNRLGVRVSSFATGDA